MVENRTYFLRNKSLMELRLPIFYSFYLAWRNFVLSVAFYCLLIISIGLAMPSLAQQSILSNKGGLKIATGAHYSPFVDDKLPQGGWSNAIVKRVLAEMSLRANLVILPWDRALKWTQDGKVFGSFPYVYSKQRAQHLLFSMAINYVPVHMYAAKASGFDSLMSLQGKRLCFPYDYSLSVIEQQIVTKFQMTVNRVKDGIGCIKHVQKGWSDAGLTNGYIDTSKLSSNHWQAKHIKVFKQQLALVPLYFVVGKHTSHAQQWIDEFNYALTGLEKSGELNRINSTYKNILGFN